MLTDNFQYFTGQNEWIPEKYSTISQVVNIISADLLKNIQTNTQIKACVWQRRERKKWTYQCWRNRLAGWHGKVSSGTVAECGVDRYIQLGKKEWYAVIAKTVVICLLEEFLIRKLLSLAVGYWSVLYSAILCSRTDSLRSHVVLHEWIAFYSAFFFFFFFF